MNGMLRGAVGAVFMLFASLSAASPVTLTGASRHVAIWDAANPAGVYGPNSLSILAGSFNDSVGILSGAGSNVLVSSSQKSLIDAAGGVFSGSGEVSVGFSVQAADQVVSQSYFIADFIAPTAMQYSLRGSLGSFMDGGLGIGQIFLLDTGSFSAVFNHVAPSTWDTLVLGETGTLAAGAYRLAALARIAPDPGWGTDAFYGGSVEYDFQFNVTAVPEPGSWALLLAGLGLLGFAARRRA
ncbi:MAG: FxDxF family PEP-CTERM protein [Rhodocyclaceae bacterium]|nr:FxDxF family PEP-CTERM protein [Rhodocyclaceae bacterium]